MVNITNNRQQRLVSEYWRWYNDILYLDLYVQTNARDAAIIGPYGLRLKVTLTSAPIDGKANKQLVCLLAKYFAVRRKNINIHSGFSSHYKTIAIISPQKNIPYNLN